VNVQAADITGFGHQHDAIPNSHYILTQQFLGIP